MKDSLMRLTFLLTMIVTLCAAGNQLNVPSGIAGAAPIWEVGIKDPPNGKFREPSKLFPGTNRTAVEMISDRIPFSILFSLLSGFKDNSERKQLHAYIQQVLLISNEDDIDALFELALEYKEQMSYLAIQANTIKESYHPKHSTFSQYDFEQLQKVKQQKEMIVDNLITSFPQHLSEESRDMLEKQVQQRVKPNIRMESLATLNPNSFSEFISTYSEIWLYADTGAPNGSFTICACAVGDLDPATSSHLFYAQVTLRSPRGKVIHALEYGNLQSFSVSVMIPTLLTWNPPDTGTYFTDAIYGSECPSWPNIGFSFASDWVGVSFIAMRKVSTTPSPNGPIYTYQRVEPCEVTCRNMIQHVTNSTVVF